MHAVLALVGEELADRLGMADDEVDERRDHQDQPQRRRPDLQCGKHFHPVDDQREDDQGRRRIAEPQRYAEAELEALRHDRALEREEDEGERREDDVGDHRAVVAEAAAAGDQVEVDVVARRVVGHRKAGDHDDDREDQDAPQRVRRAVGDADVGADGEVGEVGDAAEGRDADHPRRPLSVAARREPQRVVLEGLLGGGHGVEVGHDGLVHRLLADVLSHAAKLGPFCFRTVTAMFRVWNSTCVNWIDA